MQDHQPKAQDESHPWWTLGIDACLKILGTDPAAGLSAEEVHERTQRYGPNVLAGQQMRSPWLILAQQFSSLMVLILVGAAVVSAFMGDLSDSIVIAVILVLNAALGFSQEFRAERAMAALRQLSVPSVKVRRGGRLLEIASTELVPGDVLLLEAGALIPADGRLLESAGLRVQEAALTGESEAVDKQCDPLEAADPPLGDRLNMAYRGTIVSAGRGLLLVTATGMQTELGRIAHLLQSVRREDTPLQKKLEQLGRGLALAALVLVGVIFVQGLVRGGTGAENIKLMLMTAISMAVAAVPEGLPAVVTIALALGAQRMLRRQALIRKLLAVETLGAVTVICSDKTGTLTQNRMRVIVLELKGLCLELQEDAALGTSFGGADEQGRAEMLQQPGLRLALLAGMLCNDASLETGPAQAGQQQAAMPQGLGDPTELALLYAAAEFGLNKDELERSLPREAELPFDSERKRMATLHRLQDTAPLGSLLGSAPASGGKGWVALCKGAPDALVAACTQWWTENGAEPLGSAEREVLAGATNRLAAKGMRVLGLAFRLHETEQKPELREEELVFIGLMGLLDPPRQEVRDAVQTCRAAGIRPVIITGDHPLTALEIARQLNFDTSKGVLTGAELDQLSVEELRRQSAAINVCARVAPEHKLKIVQALQHEGEVVAMTGDGVNDAPALRKADIGVAMGITGTDVAKEAADMVLLDDNFASIVAAVEEGRVIYDNIRKFIRYLLSTNSGELWTMLLAPMLGLPIPLLPIQILWMNLVTDGLPALALSLEKAEKDIMLRPPRRSSDNIFSEGLGWHVLWVGILMAVVALGGSYLLLRGEGLDLHGEGLDRFRTMVFCIMAFLQMGHVLAIRSMSQSFFSAGVAGNPAMLASVLLTFLLQLVLLYVPALQRYFSTVPLSALEVLACLALGSVVFWAVEIEKLRLRSRHTPPEARARAA
ncbi:cation-translocating P-type ATPase [bacterium]|nr:cation-translocating P-type ATPase [bacterium]